MEGEGGNIIPTYAPPWLESVSISFKNTLNLSYNFNAILSQTNFVSPQRFWVCWEIILARLSKHIGVATPKGTVNQKLKL